MNKTCEFYIKRLKAHGDDLRRRMNFIIRAKCTLEKEIEILRSDIRNYNEYVSEFETYLRFDIFDEDIKNKNK